ncbi:MAG: D-3-phosphoglycerate dehydrogenase / 2-oxoglutarate reductase [Thermoleophilaceae bacterium]|jgi:phosphoglycerate dehydrogenase-like enzyme|nr:D-3-phosphoglycerate dehydrogenase / 2-oxoglutarate reductase [Thermoleophilaceae bacterium]
MRIVATADVPAVARQAFAPLGEIVVAALPDGAEVLIVRGGRLGADDLERLEDLRAIARTGAGYDNLDVEAATRLGIPIVYAPGVGSRPVAEGTVALMLAAAKRLRQLGAVVHDCAWASRYEAGVLDIEGACLGIVGLGSIGRHVARLCRGLGMTVIAHDPGLDGFGERDVEIVALEELLERADVITLHCALTDATRGMVDRRLLARVKPGAILVNAARGQIVESEDVLADALVTGRLSAVALDVFPREPPEPSHRLYADPRVICTPHAVGLSARWNEQVFHALARGVQGVLAGELPPNVLNLEALTGPRVHTDRAPRPAR